MDAEPCRQEGNAISVLCIDVSHHQDGQGPVKWTAHTGANLETLVITRLRTFLADQGAILDAIHDEHVKGVEQNRLIGRGHQIAEELATMAPDQIRAMLMTLLSRVDVRADRVEINIRRCRLVELLRAQAIDFIRQGGKPGSEP